MPIDHNLKASHYEKFLSPSLTQGTEKQGKGAGFYLGKIISNLKGIVNAKLAVIGNYISTGERINNKALIKKLQVNVQELTSDLRTHKGESIDRGMYVNAAIDMKGVCELLVKAGANKEDVESLKIQIKDLEEETFRDAGEAEAAKVPYAGSHETISAGEGGKMQAFAEEVMFISVLAEAAMRAPFQEDDVQVESDNGEPQQGTSSIKAEKLIAQLTEGQELPIKGEDKALMNEIRLLAKQKFEESLSRETSVSISKPKYFYSPLVIQAIARERVSAGIKKLIDEAYKYPGFAQALGASHESEPLKGLALTDYQSKDNKALMHLKAEDHAMPAKMVIKRNLDEVIRLINKGFNNNLPDELLKIVQDIQLNLAKFDE